MISQQCCGGCVYVCMSLLYSCDGDSAGRSSAGLDFLVTLSSAGLVHSPLALSNVVILLTAAGHVAYFCLLFSRE